ncbi:hypothetical protein PMAYCL1PPCAC_01052, partial [Pristionchus mayeri]
RSTSAYIGDASCRLVVVLLLLLHFLLALGALLLGFLLLRVQIDSVVVPDRHHFLLLRLRQLRRRRRRGRKWGYCSGSGVGSGSAQSLVHVVRSSCSGRRRRRGVEVRQRLVIVISLQESLRFQC